ncbi:hypothetical protein GGX14DRAFT_391366 [Mycena pura]|uniref:Uncharacterized protein n=1 Tax=Mycena pura TaxID=153505 RepID=A0AAD6YGY0_9AGAR|nr:hypothetical protein GGX14DRAFT_391366 [Mycena pura]
MPVHGGIGHASSLDVQAHAHNRPGYRSHGHRVKGEDVARGGEARLQELGGSRSWAATRDRMATARGCPPVLRSVARAGSTWRHRLSDCGAAKRGEEMNNLWRRPGTADHGTLRLEDQGANFEQHSQSPCRRCPRSSAQSFANNVDPRVHAQIRDANSSATATSVQKRYHPIWVAERSHPEDGSLPVGAHSPFALVKLQDKTAPPSADHSGVRCHHSASWRAATRASTTPARKT